MPSGSAFSARLTRLCSTRIVGLIRAPTTPVRGSSVARVIVAFRGRPVLRMAEISIFWLGGFASGDGGLDGVEIPQVDAFAAVVLDSGGELLPAFVEDDAGDAERVGGTDAHILHVAHMIDGAQVGQPVVQTVAIAVVDFDAVWYGAFAQLPDNPVGVMVLPLQRQPDIGPRPLADVAKRLVPRRDRKSTRLNSSH